ncbi:unnamed protein product (mitochondrion) [Plasmodiophora brassicae]|uniref:G-protein coupled receptors family 1 profile domain-containing protein n=1 Tax=Plasmodiophora brassicae TaxID=37360 RepID=A0A3P3XYW9_PLABS|nr:unnamed protein product [Plasmodiophora brassicae]
MASMTAVEWMASAVGIGGTVVATCAFLAALCTVVTMIQERKVTLMLASIFGATFCSGICGVCVAVMWHLYSWSPSQADMCNVLAGGILSFFYTMAVGSVLQFLYCRALLVDEKAASTKFMKLVQLAILGVFPFAIFNGVTSNGQVNDTYRICVPSNPVYVAALIVLASATFSVLLIYKFTTSLREHPARMASPQSGAGVHARNDRLEQIARRNLFFSSIALGFTTSTMVCLLINSIVFPPFDPLHMAIENLIGIVDVSINCIVICTCSNVWIPSALKAKITTMQKQTPTTKTVPGNASTTGGSTMHRA